MTLPLLVLSLCLALSDVKSFDVLMVIGKLWQLLILIQSDTNTSEFLASTSTINQVNFSNDF